MKNPRYEAKAADGGSTPAKKQKLPAGAPAPPTFRSVVFRALMASAVFYLFLSLGGGGGGATLLLVGVMFLFLLAFGTLFDRWFYKWRLRRWERKRAG